MGRQAGKVREPLERKRDQVLGSSVSQSLKSPILLPSAVHPYAPDVCYLPLRHLRDKGEERWVRKIRKREEDEDRVMI